MNEQPPKLPPCPKRFPQARLWLEQIVELILQESDATLERIARLEKSMRRLEKSKRKEDPRLLKELSRCLISLGHAPGFSPAIDVAIEDYVVVRSEINELHRFKMSELARENCEICLTEVLTRFHLALSRLGVSVHEVEPSTPLDKGKHEIVERLETEDASLINTIVECIQPEFRWKSGNIERIHRAKVKAFTHLAPDFRELKDESDEGN